MKEELIIKQLEQELDKISEKNNLKNLEIVLNDICSTMPAINSEGVKRETIKNKFLRDVQRLRGAEINKKKVIKIILQLEINDLVVIEKIYNLTGHPFSYQEEYLSDLYDEALRLYIDEVKENELLENTYESIPYTDDEHIQTSLEKYKICIHRILKFYISKIRKERKELLIKNKKYKVNQFEKFLEDLFLELYYSSKTDENEYEIFTKSESYSQMESFFDELELLNEGNRVIRFDQFKYVILLGIIEMILKPKTNNNNKIRNTLSLCKKNYIMQALINTINYDDEFSYGMFLSNYNEIFLKNNYLSRHQEFINYFTDVIVCLKRVITNFDELNSLSKKDIVEFVSNYKESIDIIAKK